MVVREHVACRLAAFPVAIQLRLRLISDLRAQQAAGFAAADVTLILAHLHEKWGERREMEKLTLFDQTINLQKF